MCCLGLPVESDPAAVGESDHGYVRFSGPGHGDANGGPTEQETLRQDQAPHFPHDGQKHSRSGHIPTGSTICHPICR